MRLLLVADTYPPARISGALQMRDLALELFAQGHDVTVLVPAHDLQASWRLETDNGVQVLRARALPTKDVPLVRRALAECLLPWLLHRALRASPVSRVCWEGLVWYSPSIFLGPLVAWLKRKHRCRGYLIVRDLFPDWAVDAGVMRRGLAYRFFKWVERVQYGVADVIGVQTPANAPLVARDAPAGACIEVLHNWLAAPPQPTGDESLPPLQQLEGRTIFVYAGNMGVAQDMGAFIELARRMSDHDDVGFLLVGRGSEWARLKREAEHSGLDNLLVLGEIAPELVPALLARCHVGIVALHPGHGTHNIPGKLLTYLHAGLPVLARANAHNDLHQLLADEGVGASVAGDAPALLHAHAVGFVADPARRAAMGEAGRRLAQLMFSPASAARQVVAGVSKG